MRIAFLGIFVLLCIQTSFGQATFTAISSNSWNNTLSWSHTGVDGDNIPDADDTATIPSGITINMTGGTSYQIASLTIQSGGTLSMNNANAVLDIFPNGGLLQVDLGGTISNAVNDDGNEINFLNNSSFVVNGIVQTDLFEFEGASQTVTITGGGTLLVRRFNVNATNVTVILNTTGSFGSNPNPFSVDSSNFTISGTGTISLGGGSADLNISAGGVSVGCTMTIVDDIAIIANSSSLTVTNGGTISVGDDLRVGPVNNGDNVTLTINNGGALTINSDILFDENNVTAPGANNFTLSNSGTISILGAINVGNASTATFTNSNLFTLGGSITNVAAASSTTITNNANATLNLFGDIDNDAALSFSANGNTVNYNGTVQTIETTTYHHLTLSNSGAKSAAGSFALRGNWSRSGTATFTPAGFTVTLNALVGTAAQTIAAVGGETFAGLTINSAFATSPQVTLNNAITISGILTMTAGNVNLNGNSVTLSSNASGALVHGLTSASGWMYGSSVIRNRPASTVITVGTAHSLFPLGSSTDWRPFFVGQTSNANSAGTMTLSHTDGTNSTTVAFAESIVRSHNSFWTVSTTGISAGPNFALRAGGTSFGTIEAGAAGLLDLRMCTNSGVVGTHGAATGGPDYRVNRTAVTFANLANSYHVASTDATNSPLPIELLDFNVNLNESNANIAWSTASELNNDFFSIERTSDVEKFEEVGTVKGQGTIHTKTNYTLVDDSPLPGKSYYRLKQTDFDGKSYFKIYPNPVVDQKFNLELKGIDPGSEVPIRIVNVQGVSVFEIKYTADKSGEVRTTLELNQLSCGMYIVIVNTATGFRKKILIQ
jgi:hypothetical protein